MKRNLPIVLFNLVALLLAPMSVVADTPEGPPLVPSTASVLAPVSNSAFLVGKKKKKGRAKKKVAVAVTVLALPGVPLPGARVSVRMSRGSFELYVGTFIFPVLTWSGPATVSFPVQLGARKFIGNDNFSFYLGGGLTAGKGGAFFQLDFGVHLNTDFGMVLALGGQQWWDTELGLAPHPVGVFELGWSF